MDHLTFARNLVKGKIAETVFAQMYRETDRYTVLEFGYEKVIPELIQRGYRENNGMIETLRTAPDFAVIDQHSRQVKLIEVKFMHHLSKKFALEAAQRMSASWNPSYLFIATLDGFFFGEINEIVMNDGHVSPLPADIIPEDVQARYLEILTDFEQTDEAAETHS
jgi:hypothetical protein